MAKKIKLKKMSIERAIELIENEHGGCDQNTCTLGVALRYGYDLVAIDHWIGSCAACDEFHNAELDYTNKELTAQSKKMCKELEHIDCPHCDSILWLPDETDYYCDSCARDIPKPAKLKRP